MQAHTDIPRLARRIVLVGFMGAGKSTVGPMLADRMGWRFIDADQHLQTRTGLTIAELFSNLGEAGFRKMEADIFAELHGQQELVLALGGGAVESEATRSILAESADTWVVFLTAPLEVLIERCESQPNAAERPVLRQREALKDRFQSRLRHYERAHITVDTNGVRPHEVVESILHRLPESAFAFPLTQRATSI